MAKTESPEQIYRYLAPSSVVARKNQTQLALSTSGGCDANPQLARGFVVDAQSTARALLVVGQVAGTRFWMPPNMVIAAILAADPVVTTSKSGIRFESFSLCGGVYASLELDESGFDGTIDAYGTTNVDMGSELKSALSQIARRDPLLMKVGPMLWRSQQLEVRLSRRRFHFRSDG